MQRTVSGVDRPIDIAFGYISLYIALAQLEGEFHEPPNRRHDGIYRRIIHRGCDPGIGQKHTAT